MTGFSLSQISRRSLLRAGALLPAAGFAQQGPKIDPYAMTGGRRGGRHLGPVPINDGDINVVSSQAADLSGPLEGNSANYMRLWVGKTAEGECEFTWDLDVERAGAYDVRALTRAGQPYILTLHTVDGRITKDVGETGWQRAGLGQLDLREGKQVLRLISDSSQFDLSALEIVRPAVWQQIQRGLRSLVDDVGPAVHCSADQGARRHSAATHNQA